MKRLTQAASAGAAAKPLLAPRPGGHRHWQALQHLRLGPSRLASRRRCVTPAPNERTHWYHHECPERIALRSERDRANDNPNELLGRYNAFARARGPKRSTPA